MFTSSQFIALCLAVVALSNGVCAEKEAAQTFRNHDVSTYSNAGQYGAGRGAGDDGVGARLDGWGTGYGGTGTGEGRVGVDIAGVRTDVGGTASVGGGPSGGANGEVGEHTASVGGTVNAEKAAIVSSGVGRTAAGTGCIRTASRTD
ncbi:unnamed protein product [Peronospora farinosa]|uniref:Uncharacterized protein n=1 Tax=Peronospora farinosa TaxID=134698 RepID=A0AAV0TVR4_9STRA|nr:unnamed protein product [Peronospora farinosa]CAI5727054.1 unnamed protein product [Peronospora farinosa]